MNRKSTWEWLVVASGMFTLFVVVILLLTQVSRKIGEITETVTWYQTQVKPQIEAQRAREQQILAQAAAQTPEKREQQPRPAQATPTPTPGGPK
jgi:hypothetical protein